MPNTHGPIQKEQYEQMNKLARELDDLFNDGKKGAAREWGFALLVFPFGNDPGARMNYISNALREDMLVALKEFIARNEGRHHEHKNRQ